MRIYYTYYGLTRGSIPGGGMKEAELNSVVTSTYDKTSLINIYAVSHACAFPVTTLNGSPTAL
eukprot:1140958-Pelagomonas_calceolata.AAC.2